MAPSKETVSYETLKGHKSRDDIWIVVDKYVYDMSRFAKGKLA